MLMGDDLTEEDLENAITEEGKVMVSVHCCLTLVANRRL